MAAGCTHNQLRWNTVHQSRTLTDIYEQQVLDNLAMFVYDSGSLPFFSFPNAGGSNVNDAGAVNGVLNWTHGVGGLNSGALTLNGSRNVTESWTLTPIIDPVKLQLMRCAYQQVVSNCGIGEMALDCPDCQKMRNAYMGIPGDCQDYACEKNPPEQCRPTATHDPTCPANDTAKGAGEGPPKGGAPDSGTHNTPSFPGAVTTDCLQPHCWIGFGCKKCVPKHCKCLKVGHYCGMYVWVLPGGQNELTKLTLNVLNYAYNDPTPARTKEVTWEFARTEDSNGCQPAASLPAPATTAASFAAHAAATDPKITVKATIPFAEPVVPFCANNTGSPNCGREPATKNIFERSWLQYGTSQPSPIPGAGYLQFQQNQMNLTPQGR